MDNKNNITFEGLPFEQIFPIFTNAIQDFPTIQNLKEVQDFCASDKNNNDKKREAHQEFLQNTKKLMFPQINEEMKPIIPEWIELLKMHDQLTNVHTFYVVYLIFNDEEAKRMSKWEQNILKWSALLHDIRKQGPPVHEGKDHVHPFNGARQALEILQRLNIICINNEQQLQVLNQIKILIEQSQQEVHFWYRKGFTKKQKFCDKMHSHHLLTDIFKLLWTYIAPRGSFVDLVIRLVMFHQSLPGIDNIPPMVEMTKEEQLIYCDDQFFKLIKILMMNDSLSYMYINDYDKKKDDCLRQFQEKNMMMMYQWHSNCCLLDFHQAFKKEQKGKEMEMALE